MLIHVVFRIDLSQTIGMKVTSSSFSGPASQKISARVGFVEDGSYLYADMAKAVGFPMNSKCEAIKTLSYVHQWSFICPI